ncbi:hypothetical protein [Mobilicoccus pelagius]|uniref:Uncharacterized protein n=1 Tax=Mobilicoccus pelagius NBRC 104925 TaxID=1089455 RepID=H5UQK6_9MICO|nr:hypothetical protein [Mobilicoccus pelagius]GAB48014.1 hypothetical protein MOPEL_032_00560 [Mobilicoccus pelagius NBRC 104925]
MRAAIRLWWLMRSTCGRRHDVTVGGPFGLFTWVALTCGGLLTVARGPATLDVPRIGALLALGAALTLMGVWCTRTLLRPAPDEHLRVLRATGASRHQAAVVAALDVAESAVPGVLAGVACGVGLAWLLHLIGADVVPPLRFFVLTGVALCALLAATVARRLDATDRPDDETGLDDHMRGPAGLTDAPDVRIHRVRPTPEPHDARP